MRYSKVPTIFRSKEQFAAALGVDPNLVIESPMATVWERHVKGFFFKSLEDLFNERKASSYTQYEHKKRLSFVKPLSFINKEELCPFKYIYMPFDTLIYVSVANGVARFDLLEGSLEFTELGELPEVPKEPYFAEYIFYFLYSIPFRYSRKPSETKYVDGEHSGYRLDDKRDWTGFDSYSYRPDCPAGTDFNGALCLVKFDMQSLPPIRVKFSQTKKGEFLSVYVESAIEGFLRNRIPPSTFNVLGHEVVFGELGRVVGIFITTYQGSEGSLIESFDAKDLLKDKSLTGVEAAVAVGSAQVDGEAECIRVPVPHEGLVSKYVSTLEYNCSTISALCLNPTESEQARRMYDVLKSNVSSQLFQHLSYPYNIRLRLIDNTSKQFISCLDVPCPFGKGEITYRQGVFCPKDYVPVVEHHPVPVKTETGKEVMAYPVFESEELCVYMTQNMKLSKQFFFFSLNKSSQTLIEQSAAYRFGYCEALGCVVRASNDLRYLVLE